MGEWTPWWDRMLAEDPGVCRTRGRWFTDCRTGRRVLSPRRLWRHWRWSRKWWGTSRLV